MEKAGNASGCFDGRPSRRIGPARPHRWRRSRLALALALTVATVLLFAAPASAVTVTFNFTDAPQDFVVPAGVTQVTVQALGAAGGAGGDDGGAGANGGSATATIAVTPGETLSVFVGGQGGDGVGTSGGDGGFNGGAAGASAGGVGGGGGGGGASDIRRAPGALGDRLVVAGGGGGGGGKDSDTGGDGGAGGGLTGADGDDATGVDFGHGGDGGTQSAGGDGGEGGVGTNGAPGALGTGGAGTGQAVGGGGGGGGYYGGGGGEEGGAPGGGGGGGGGSGFTPDGNGMTNGVRSGNGLVEISYVVTPTLTTSASPDVTLGGQVSDTATLANGASPTGEISFDLYGPGDADCSGSPAFTDTKAVSGNGSYSSAEFTPTETGTYRWIASYSGDADNNPVAGACNDAGESVTVSALPPDPPPDVVPALEITGVELNRRKGTATLSAQANVAGQLHVAKSNKVKPDGPATLKDAGSVELDVVARNKAREKLEQKGKVSVNPKVILAPSAGGELLARRQFKLRLD